MSGTTSLQQQHQLESQTLLDLLDDSEETIEALRQKADSDAAAHRERERRLLEELAAAKAETATLRNVVAEKETALTELSKEVEAKKAFGASRLASYEATIAELEQEVQLAHQQADDAYAMLDETRERNTELQREMSPSPLSPPSALVEISAVSPAPADVGMEVGIQTVPEGEPLHVTSLRHECDALRAASDSKDTELVVLRRRVETLMKDLEKKEEAPMVCSKCVWGSTRSSPAPVGPSSSGVSGRSISAHAHVNASLSAATSRETITPLSAASHMGEGGITASNSIGSRHSTESSNPLLSGATSNAMSRNTSVDGFEEPAPRAPLLMPAPFAPSNAGPAVVTVVGVHALRQQQQQQQQPSAVFPSAGKGAPIGRGSEGSPSPNSPALAPTSINVPRSNKRPASPVISRESSVASTAAESRSVSRSASTVTFHSPVSKVVGPQDVTTKENNLLASRPRASTPCGRSNSRSTSAARGTSFGVPTSGTRSASRSASVEERRRRVDEARESLARTRRRREQLEGGVSLSIYRRF